MQKIDAEKVEKMILKWIQQNEQMNPKQKQKQFILWGDFAPNMFLVMISMVFEDWGLEKLIQESSTINAKLKPEQMLCMCCKMMTQTGSKLDP